VENCRGILEYSLHRPPFPDTLSEILRDFLQDSRRLRGMSPQSISPPIARLLTNKRHFKVNDVTPHFPAHPVGFDSIQCSGFPDGEQEHPLSSGDESTETNPERVWGRDPMRLWRALAKSSPSAIRGSDSHLQILDQTVALGFLIPFMENLERKAGLNSAELSFIFRMKFLRDDSSGNVCCFFVFFVC